MTDKTSNKNAPDASGAFLFPIIPASGEMLREHMQLNGLSPGIPPYSGACALAEGGKGDVNAGKTHGCIVSKKKQPLNGVEYSFE